MQALQLTTPAGCTDILIGELLSSRLNSLEKEAILLVDENVLDQHEALFSPYKILPLPSGEQHKTLQTVEGLYRELVKLGADRSGLIVGVGGGLATDVAGFVASTFLRGISFGFISSTLLGQVDASIGGKNGVNLDGYKNMIGNICQPAFVWCDLSLLDTLEHREYVSGIAEVIKYGAIRDIHFMDYLEEQMQPLLKKDMGVLEKVVSTSAAIKADVVQQDEHEGGLRKILNFGHTFGHAIERHKSVLHGEAIALGMVMAARYSQLRGSLSVAEADRLEALLTAAGLPVQMELDADEIYQNILKDKKKSGEDVHFILLKGIGDALIEAIALSDLKSIVHDLC